jgi:hypothetical protein
VAAGDFDGEADDDRGDGRYSGCRCGCKVDLALSVLSLFPDAVLRLLSS